MKRHWKHADRNPAAHARAQLRATAAATPFRRRIDAALVLLLIITVLVGSGAWTVGVNLAQRYGVGDPPVVQALADERLQVNVRDAIAEKSLRDAVLHVPERRVYFLQEGGTIHSYDPATRLWTSERPFGNTTGLIGSELTQLRSGCGRDPAAERGDACVDPNTLWAISEQGGLLRRNGGNWEVVMSDVSWTGKRGQLVQASAITAAALSGDGRWLALATNGDGIGLYDNRSAIWVAQAALQRDEANPDVATALGWWGERFWIGGPQGLVSFTPDAQRPRFTTLEDHSNPVLDLDVADDGLYLLERRQCDTGTADCLWLGRFDAPERPAISLIDQHTRYAGLNRDDLVFAQQWERHLVVAGGSGIYTYNLDQHNWQQLFDQPVTVALALPQDGGFYFAHPGGAGRLLPDGNIKRWELAGDTIIRLLFGNDTSDVLALTGNGHLLSLGTEQTPNRVFQAGSTTFEPSSFTVAVDVGEQVLLIGMQGALLHNPVTRSYIDIPQASLPSWMQQEPLRAFRSDDHVYFLAGNGSNQSIYAAPVDDLLDPQVYNTTLRQLMPQPLDGTPQRIWAWPGEGLGILDTSGNVLAVSPTGITRRTGDGSSGLERETLLDVTAWQDDLIVATDAGVRYYDAGVRGWVFGADPAQRIEELGVAGGRLLGRSEHQELLQIADTTEALIGDRTGSQISDADLSDARLLGEHLYLAGGGVVEQYSLEQRRVIERWSIKLGESTRIREIVDGVPLVQVDDMAFLGTLEIDPTVGPVLGLAADSSTIWTTREADGLRYLKGYPSTGSLQGNGARCLFRNPWMAATRIDDARALPNGALAVATDGGLMFYAPTARSWYATQQSLGSAGARLHLLGDYLAVAEPSDAPTQVALIPLDSIEMPDSCSTNRVNLNASSTTVQAAVFDEGTGRAAWLNEQGALIEWRAGSATEVLAANRGPDQRDLRRVFQRDSYLLFTTDNALWRYELGNHNWQRIGLTFGETISSTLDINVEGSASAETVTVRVSGNRWFVGQFVPPADSVMLRPLLEPPTRTFGSNASDLVDVVERGETWVFVLADRLRYFDPIQRRWLDDVPLGSADPSLLPQQALDRMVVVGNAGRRWWVAQDTNERPETLVPFDLPQNEQVALDSNSAIWRLNGNGELSRCEAEAGAYRCVRANEPPMQVADADVRRAYEWQNHIILDTASGVRAFDPQQATELPIRDAPRFANATTVREFQGLLLMHDGAQLAVLSDGDTITARTWNGVTALVSDAGGAPWAQFGQSWRRWSGTDWVEPPLPDQRSLADLGARLFLSETSSPVALDRDGTLYRWSNGLRADALKLPAAFLPNQIDMLVPGPQNSWWVRTGSRLSHLVPGMCAPAATTTPTATATPTATQPCLTVRGGVDLPAAFQAPNTPLISVAAANQISLTMANGSQVLVTADSANTYQITNGAVVAPQGAGQLADLWGSLRARLRPLARGGTALDPMESLIVAQDGSLIAARPSRQVRLAGQGVTQFAAMPALDANWLSWNRSASEFTVAGASGPLRLRKDQFIVNRALIVEPLGAVIAEAASRFHVANQHGLWTFTQASTSLNDASITYTPVALNGIEGAAHGAILTTGGDLMLGSSALQAARASLQVTLGDLEVVEQVRTRSVSASIARAGGRVAALGDEGFLFDRERRGLAFGNGSLLVQSAAGIHRATAFGPFELGPTAVTSGQLTSESGVGVLFHSTGRWFQQQNANWQPLNTDPTRNRVLITNTMWDWSMRNGAVNIALKQGAALNFGLGPSGLGIGFRSDQVRAALSFGGGLVVVSEAFVEWASGPDQLAQLDAPRTATLPVDRLEGLVAADGSRTLFRTVGTSVSRWNATTQSFEATADPALQWSLVDSARLRFTRRSNQVEKQLRLDLLNGNDRWLNFSWIDRRFPFDVVTSFDVLGNQLFVGSAAGLQVYSNSAALGLNQMSRLYDLSGTSGGALATVTRIGRPLSNPNVLMARAGICIELSSSALQQCQQPSQLDVRLRVATDLWEWTANAQGELAGRYYGRGGTPMLPVQVTSGRFSHDRLRDVAVCSGHAFSVWEAGWITVHPDTTIALQTGLAHDALTDFLPQRLLCLERELRLAQSKVPIGLYAVGARGDWRVFSGTTWQPVSDSAVVDALRERLARPPQFERGNLRVMPPASGDGVQFEVQTLAASWQPLAWDGDRIGIDRWREVVVVGNRLWAATSSGMVPFLYQPQNPIRLDPASMIVLREPNTDGNLCTITDLARSADAVVARCDHDSAQLYSGVLDGSRDRGVFAPLEGDDPFVRQVMVSRARGKVWEWVLEGRRDGDPGLIEIRRVGNGQPEPIALVSGQFDFDAIDSLALFRDGRLELAGEGGWFTMPRSNLAADAWERPSTLTPPPAEIHRLGLARQGDERWLCLVSDTGTYRLSPDGTSEAGRCTDAQGEHELWRYERELDSGTLVMPGRDGRGQRVLENGRFTDDTAAGVPVVLREGDAFSYLVPTEAGVVHLTAGLQKQAITTEFAGMPSGGVPTALYLWDSTTPSYVANGGLYSLQDGQRLLDLPLDLPENVTIDAIEDGPHDLLLVRWVQDQQRGWSVFARTVGLPAARNRLLLDLNEFPRYQQNRVAWGVLPAQAELAIDSERVSLLWPGLAQPAQFPYPTPLELVAAISYGERVLLIGRHELYEVNIAPMLLAAQQGR